MKHLACIILLASAGLVFGQPVTKLLDAFASYEDSRYAEAARLFDELAKEKSVQANEYIYYKGLALYNLGDYNAASVAFKHAQEEGIAEASLWLAKTQVLNGDSHLATSTLDKYLKAAGAIDIETIKKDTVFRYLHTTEEWFQLWQEGNLDPGQITYSDAIYYLKRNQFANAHRILENSTAYKSGDQALFALNSMVYSEEGIQQLALDEINKSLKIDEKNIEYLNLKASYLQVSDRNADALEVLNTIIEIAPEDFTARYQRSKIAFEEANYTLAKSDLDILTKYFTQASYSFLLGKTDYELGNYISALKAFNKIIETEPPRAEYYKARGVTYYQTRIFDQAAYDLSMSLDLRPDDDETNLFLGLSENNRGNHKMACYYLQRAKNFGSMEAADYLNSLCK